LWLVIYMIIYIHTTDELRSSLRVTILLLNLGIFYVLSIILVHFQISNEETIIPGWEGKIVAWIEKDTGQ